MFINGIITEAGSALIVPMPNVLHTQYARVLASTPVFLVIKTNLMRFSGNFFQMNYQDTTACLYQFDVLTRTIFCHCGKQTRLRLCAVDCGTDFMLSNIYISTNIVSNHAGKKFSFIFICLTGARIPS